MDEIMDTAELIKEDITINELMKCLRLRDKEGLINILFDTGFKRESINILKLHCRVLSERDIFYPENISKVVNILANTNLNTFSISKTWIQLLDLMLSLTTYVQLQPGLLLEDSEGEYFER
jgi:hypothetical protein